MSSWLSALVVFILCCLHCMCSCLLPLHLLHNNIKTTFNCLEYAFRIPVLEYEDDVGK